jgi:hypothetical protein
MQAVIKSSWVCQLPNKRPRIGTVTYTSFIYALEETEPTFSGQSLLHPRLQDWSEY